MIHPSNFRSNFSSPSLTCILITFPIWTRREEKMKKKNFFQLSLNVSFYESEENLSNFDRHTMCGSGSRRERFDIPRKNSQVRLFSSGCCVMSVWRKNVGKSMFGEQNKMKNSRLWLCARERSLLNGDERPAVSYWDHRVYTTEKKQSTHEEENCEKSSAIIEAWRTAIVFWRAWYLPRCDDRGPPATGCWRDDVALEHQQQREKWKNSNFSSSEICYFRQQCLQNPRVIVALRKLAFVSFSAFSSARSFGVGVWRFSRETRRAKRRACECVSRENSNALGAEVAYKFECSSPLLV